MNYDEILKELQSAIDQDSVGINYQQNSNVDKPNPKPNSKTNNNKTKNENDIYLSKREKVRLLEDVNKVIAYLKPIVDALQ